MKFVINFLLVTLIVTVAKALDDNDGKILSSYDSRIPSENNAVVRLMPSEGTAFFTTPGWFVTAAHCFPNPSRIYTIETNVPHSKDDGTIKRPDIKDIYLVDSRSIQISTGDKNEQAQGNDWAVFKLIIKHQIKYNAREDVTPFRIALLPSLSPSLVKPLVSIIGFGVAGPPPNFGQKIKGVMYPRNIYSQTQQKAIGHIKDNEISKNEGIIIEDKLIHDVDAASGCSGGPIIRGDAVIGIHNGYLNDKNLNYGTGFHIHALQMVLDNKTLSPNNDKISRNYKGDYVPYLIHVDAGTVEDQNGDGTLFRPFRNMQSAISAAQNDKVLSIVGGVYPLEGGFSFPLGKKITVMFPSGGVKFIGTGVSTANSYSAVKREHQLLTTALQGAIGSKVDKKTQAVKNSTTCSLL